MRILQTSRELGRVALMANAKCASHIVDQGGDDRELRRWQTSEVKTKADMCDWHLQNMSILGYHTKSNSGPTIY